MTLIVGLLNKRNALLLADRRLTIGQRIEDDHYNKVTLLCCHDARVGIAFTGLAKAQSFDTDRYLMDFLDQASFADDRIDTIGQELAENLSGEFTRRGFKGHSLVFVMLGYRHSEGATTPFCAQVSNCSEDGSIRPLFCYDDLSPPDGIAAPVFGMHTAVNISTLAELKKIAGRAMEPQAALRKLVISLDKAASSIESKGTIGHRCNSVVIPYSVNNPMVATYHVADAEGEAHGPNFAVTGFYYSTGVMMSAGEALAGSGSLKKNSPCWCGSRRRFKECHLKKFGSAYARTPHFPMPLTWGARIQVDDQRPSGDTFMLSGGFA